MKKEVRIYLLKAVTIDLESKERSDYNKLISIQGYYTNLKELYNNFDSDTIQSYSTVASHINQKGFYRIRDGKFRFHDSLDFFNEITITRVLANNIYTKRTVISLTDLLLKEASRVSQDGFSIFR